MTARRTRLAGIAIGSAAALSFVFVLSVRGADDGLLTGTITSPTGTPLEGVIVSAQILGEPRTTSVYTGADGRYFFPPLKGGKYNMWAQGIGLERGEAVADVATGTKRLDFKLNDTDDIIPQLSGYQSLTMLPEDTAAHRRGKLLLQRNCTYCHESATVLRDRFDQHGWEVIVGVMLNGFNPGNSKPLTPPQKELVAYLTEVRGPDSPPLKVANPAAFRPKGEATLPVVYEFDVEFDKGGYSAHNGSDWRFGQASSAGGGGGIHDSALDFDSNIWFTSTASESDKRTVAKVDGKTGKLTNFPIRMPNGKAALAHGIFLDTNDGKLYFNASPKIAYLDGDLGIIDPKVDAVEATSPPEGMSRVSGWLGGDAKGFIWAASGTPKKGGALRFDPRTKMFKQFDSPTAGLTYGITGDKNGNGWWMGVNDDIIVFGNPSTGEISEIKLPAQPLAEFLKPGDLSEGEQIPQPGLGGNQAPRRPYADLNGKDLWVTNFRGNTVIRIDVDTKELKYYGAPYPGMNPYEALVDSKHRLWVSFQNSDEIGRFDPDTGKWTLYSWPTKGAAQRNQHWLERDGVLQFALASGMSHRVGRMVVPTPAEIEALRARVR